MWNYGPCGGFQWMWIFPLIGLIVMLLMVSSIFGRGRFRPPCGRWNADEGGTGEQKPDGPLEILKRRYAKGDITQEEYQRMKRDLE